MKDEIVRDRRFAEGSSSSSTVVFIVLAVWLVTAIVVAASGVLESPPPRVTPVLVWGPVVVFLIAFARSLSFRAWALHVNIRWLVLYHVVRAGIGTGFLLMSGDELPPEFADTAGVGDVVVGISALILALGVSTRTAIRRRIIFTWNLIGLLDMILVFVTAQRLVLFGDDPDAMVELTAFPLLLVPIFVVPLVLITHFTIFAQLWRARGR